jgi:hypothetical protein
VIAAPSVFAPLWLETRRHLGRAWRFFRPDVQMVLIVAVAAALVGLYLRTAHGRLEAERTAAWACREAVQAIVRVNRIHDRIVLPADPCRALRVLKGEQA